MRIYGKKNVFDAALDRVRWLFDEFPNVIVGFSGGKDSIVVFQLCMLVAREKHRLPLKVFFLDQEAEWQATIDMVTEVMESPDVEPLWFQMPIRLFNATSTTEHWLHCWDPKDEHKWMRERVPYSLKDNHYGTDRFGKIFAAIHKHDFADVKTCYVAGVRTEESPRRFMALTHSIAYKWATWGGCLNTKRQHYTMYPLYDWSYSDVWAAIHRNKWSYNAVYDKMFQYGYNVKDMRVSNIHHETAVEHIFFLQEIEPETYARLTHRISGIDTAGKLGVADYFVTELPFMFVSWREYRDYLLEKLITSEDWRDRFRKKFAKHEETFAEIGDGLYKVHIASILTNDWEMVKLGNFERAPEQHFLKKRKLALAAAEEP